MKKYLLLLSIIYLGQVNGQIINTIAGNGTQGYSGDGGQATLSQLNNPSGIAFDKFGNLYFAEWGNHVIRKVNTSGVISTIAGTGVSGYAGDGGLATSAQLNATMGLAIDTAGNIYVADSYNNRIRKIDINGIITTFAGTGTSGYTGDNGPAVSAKLNLPSEMVIDHTGNIFFTDWNNNVIRKINTSGIITTFAGNGTTGYTGDGGQATAASLNIPRGMITDLSGNVFFSDEFNYVIRKVDSLGIITTIVGTGAQGNTGDGGLSSIAQLNIPLGLEIDSNGNLFIADCGNNRIRKVNTSNIINAFAGNGTQGYSGDGGLASSCEFYSPYELTFDQTGNLYISDTKNHVIRKVTLPSAVELFANEKQITIFPNPTSDQFFIDANTTDKLTVDLYDVNGRHVFSASVSDKSNINVATLNEGVYTSTIKTVDRIINKKLVIIH